MAPNNFRGNNRSVKNVVSCDRNCKQCDKQVKNGILCNLCDKYLHFRCGRIDPALIDSANNDAWACDDCKKINENGGTSSDSEKYQDEQVCRTAIDILERENSDLKRENENLIKEINMLKCKLAYELDHAKQREAELQSKDAIICILREEKQQLASENNVYRPHNVNLNNEFTLVSQKNSRRYSDVARTHITQVMGRHTAIPTLNRFEILENSMTAEDNERGNTGNITNHAKTQMETELKRVIVMGDSLLKYSGEKCKQKGYKVLCYPGIRTEELKHKVQLMDLKTSKPDVIAVHVGTNDIRKGVFAEEIMGDTMDLIDYIQTQTPSTKIIVSSILNRSDVSTQRISRINEELDWLCSVRKCTIIHGNSWLEEIDFAKDGVHLNRRGAYKLGRLLNNAIESDMKQGTEEIEASRTEDKQSKSYQRRSMGNGKKQTCNHHGEEEKGRASPDQELSRPTPRKCQSPPGDTFLGTNRTHIV